MKKALPYILGVVAVLLILLGVSLVKPNKAPAPDQSKELNAQLVKACDLLTPEDAKAVIGAEIEPADDGNAASSSSSDIAVSSCAFVQKLVTGVTAANQKQASLLVRTARTETGEVANKDVFIGKSKPSKAEEVKNIGNTAFWNPEFGQLNVLKDNNWYIIEVGSSVPSERKLDDAKKLAEFVI